jgi:signal transduction histidine kinase
LSSKDTSFAIEFAALAFRSPATNRYRYRLEGLDQDWHEVGSDRRIASYTTLPAGSYTFRVQGATNRGPWSEPGAAVHIQIDRPWWATWEFRTLVTALALAIAVGVYAYRMRQLSRTLEIRFDERMGERTRIARDLHDTLLQTFHGLLLQFRAAYQLLPSRPEDARRRLGTAIEGAFEAITEGRNAVQGLRALAVGTNDLAPVIKTLGEDLMAQGTDPAPVEFRVEVSGTAIALRPLARDEIYRIAGESLRNAFRHSSATRIEVDLYYETRALRLRVRDNGKGIDAQFLNDHVAGGHYGIPGMRERANLLGGKLTIWTAPASGTEIDLSVAASQAYVETSSQRRWFVRRWFGPREPNES